MNFDEYQEKARKFALYKNVMYPFLGLAEETGEFLGLLAKAQRGDDLLSRFGSEEKLNEAILKEAGDVIWMLANCLAEQHLSLQDAAELNIKKLTDRQARGVLQGNGDNR